MGIYPVIKKNTKRLLERALGRHHPTAAALTVRRATGNGLPRPRPSQAPSQNQACGKPNCRYRVSTGSGVDRLRRLHPPPPGARRAPNRVSDATLTSSPPAATGDCSWASTVATHGRTAASGLHSSQLPSPSAPTPHLRSLLSPLCRLRRPDRQGE